MGKADEAAVVLANAEKVKQAVHVAQGALQAREQEYEQSRRECVALGLDPDRIDEQIRDLEEQVSGEICRLQAQLAQAERVLQGG